MPDYSQGKVYRILQDGTKTVYIGSTTQPLSARMAGHRKGLKRWPHLKLYLLMAEVGIDHFTIELIVDCPCDRREVLLRAEGEQIRRCNTKTDGCNKYIAGQTGEEYRQLPEIKNKQAERGRRPEIKAYQAEYARRPERKVKMAEYAQRPEVKAKRAENERQRRLLRRHAAIAPVEVPVIE